MFKGDWVENLAGYVVDEPMPTPDPLVYFVTALNVPDYPVKIGRSSTASLRRRIDQFQTAHPYKLGTLFVMVAEGAIENLLHEEFSKDRLAGEWFARTPELMDMIAELEGHDANWRDLY